MTGSSPPRLAPSPPISSGLSPPASAAPSPAGRLFRLSIGTYFMGGFVVSLVSLLVPRLKLLIGLSYFQASLVQFAFHSSYLLFALPITTLLVRIGYMRGIALGLAVMVLGCLGVATAAGIASYPAILVALLTLAGGITFLQIAGNVVIAVVEHEDRAIARMTLLQGFNSVGTVIAPLFGASFLLADDPHGPGGWLMLALPFAAMSLVLAGLATAFARARDLLAALPAPRPVPLARLATVLGDARLLAGSAAMFGYVGAEVTIGSLLPSYLVRADTLALSPVDAGRLVSLYWAGAMVGRFAGTIALRRWAPPRVLALVAGGALLLVLIAMATHGALGATALVAVGLCNAVMYPTLFTLSLPDDEAIATHASMLLCMAVVGGAVVPVLTGMVADAGGLRISFTLSAGCYVGIAAFAIACVVRWPGRQPERTA